MNRRMSVLFGLALLAAASPARAGWGLPSAPSASKGGATAADIDQFLLSATKADEFVQHSAVALFKAVGSKEEVEKIKAQIVAAKQIADPKEREAAQQKAIADMTKSLQTQDWEKAKSDLAASHDADKKNAVKDGIWNLALGGLMNTEVVAVGKKIVSGPPDPTVAAKLQEAGSAVDKLVSQGQGLTKVLGGAKQLMTTVGLQALPAKASDAPKAIAGDFP